MLFRSALILLIVSTVTSVLAAPHPIDLVIRHKGHDGENNGSGDDNSSGGGGSGTNTTDTSLTDAPLPSATDPVSNNGSDDSNGLGDPSLTVSGSGVNATGLPSDGSGCVPGSTVTVTVTADPSSATGTGGNSTDSSDDPSGAGGDSTIPDDGSDLPSGTDTGLGSTPTEDPASDSGLGDDEDVGNLDGGETNNDKRGKRFAGPRSYGLPKRRFQWRQEADEDC